MTVFRGIVRKTLEARFEFSSDEIEEGDDEMLAAYEIALSLPLDGWEVEDVEVDAYEL